MDTGAPSAKEEQFTEKILPPLATHVAFEIPGAWISDLILHAGICFISGSQAAQFIERFREQVEEQF
jgi:hypothetical protein